MRAHSASKLITYKPENDLKNKQESINRSETIEKNLSKKTNPKSI